MTTMTMPKIQPKPIMLVHTLIHIIAEGRRSERVLILTGKKVA
jgi:hypothetical protein